MTLFTWLIPSNSKNQRAQSDHYNLFEFFFQSYLHNPLTIWDMASLLKQ
jgi:hypothetical protein